MVAVSVVVSRGAVPPAGLRGGLARRVGEAFRSPAPTGIPTTERDSGTGARPTWGGCDRASRWRRGSASATGTGRDVVHRPAARAACSSPRHRSDSAVIGGARQDAVGIGSDGRSDIRRSARSRGRIRRSPRGLGLSRAFPRSSIIGGRTWRLPRPPPLSGCCRVSRVADALADPAGAVPPLVGAGVLVDPARAGSGGSPLPLPDARSAQPVGRLRAARSNEPLTGRNHFEAWGRLTRMWTVTQDAYLKVE